MLERALYAREGIELVESGAQFTCFTGTTVQILTELVEADFVDNSACVELIEISLLALLVQQYKY
jgi:hypothetical protein